MQGDLDTAKDRNNQLEMRKPLLTTGRFILTKAILSRYGSKTIALRPRAQGARKSMSPSPRIPSSTAIFTCTARICTDYFLVRDTPKGEFRVFWKIIKHNPPIRQFNGYITVEVEGQFPGYGYG